MQKKQKQNVKRIKIILKLYVKIITKKKYQQDQQGISHPLRV